ncbi:PCRF domain-containing protein, partial [Candidatus Tremblaya phenacola]|uniref:PCRF domain-containing protein n=1 Tax=Candidatus Tremblayella phenacoccinincola TaxID=1010676 RepID=UPI001CF6BDBE
MRRRFESDFRHSLSSNAFVIRFRLSLSSNVRQLLLLSFIAYVYKQPYSMLEKPIIENRILKLEERLRLLKDKISFEVKKEKINDLVNKLNNKTIWNNKSLIKELNRELSLLRFDVSILDKLLEDFRDIKEIFRHITANLNKATSITLFDINNELCVLDKKIEQLELSLMFKDKSDMLDCYIDIQAGTGGVDSQDWTSILLRMYLRWASMHRFKTEVIHEMVGDLNKPKSVTIKVLGVYAYGWLRTETGIHRLVRKSPFSSNGKRHTSFSSIYVYPVISDDINIYITP